MATLLTVMSMDGMCLASTSIHRGGKWKRNTSPSELNGTVLEVEDVANVALYVESDEARLKAFVWQWRSVARSEETNRGHFSKGSV
ncbi:hypothetical protein TRIUR3_29196 [Triticum urartu]|uniref:Uncharacterized protein n=1 Tax=Triticum urartu TaxID=4572 RepID=M7YHA0_TRIUA|nr:hypothetical protein TRIUR3_29196 [Triticum urartu]